VSLDSKELAQGHG